MNHHPYCRNCDRQAPRSAPRGWYNLTVNVPTDIDHGDRGYIWLGVFCSLRCLHAHWPELQKQDDETLDLYRRD